MRKPEFGRKLEQGIVKIEAKAILEAKVECGGPEAIVLDFVLLGAYLNTRFKPTQHVHSGVVSPLRFEFEQNGQLNKTEGGLLEFGHHGIVLIAKIYKPLIKRNGGQRPDIEQIEQPDIENKARGKPNGVLWIDGIQASIWPEGGVF